eukprot:TRINITY_DN1951_c0_g1_i2.p1 TRINITY_DN1951_c0_g1~~TRINITY_DN1951_c0_g1_i2.p1  ORF type:complete len:434 (+),score=24.96 TRINITY_DN1951_c0_g1_i2:67-1368(+)
MLTPHKLGLHNLLKFLSPVLRPVLNIPTKRRLENAVNIADLRLCAEKRLPRMIFGYLDTGSDDEISLRRNKDAYTQYDMHFKVLAGLSPPLDLSTKLFGSKVDIPFFASPSAGNRMFHHEGELAVAEVSKTNNSVYCLSTVSTTSFEQISQVLDHQHPKVFQVYVWKNVDLIKELLGRAKKQGFSSMALTVDGAWYGNRERDIRNGFTIPPAYTMSQIGQALRAPAWSWDFLSNPAIRYALIREDLPAENISNFVNSLLNPSFSWKDAEWLCKEWGDEGPRIIKGICRPEDAIKALNCGFSHIWVSNHGGRQLDTSPATIDVLPAIRKAVGPNVEIIVDGGIQRGTDIAKALALGADGVAIGKPYLYGLSAGGRQGVDKAFQILRRELDRAMGLLGVGTVEELKVEGSGLIRRLPMSGRDSMGARYSKAGLVS